MATVYAVVHGRIGKRAALKVLHGDLVGEGCHPERMLLEACVVNAVGHPNIVDIFDTGTLPDGRPYIVMERLAGEPLSARAERGIPPNEVVAILLEVGEALIAAHAAGVIHRDLKLDNIFLVEPADAAAVRRVKLLDWGIARMLDANPAHTLDGQLVGTPPYLAPEQARGTQVSPQTDVYSLGVVAYELFLGRLPFEADSAAELMAMHMMAPVPSPSERWPFIPRVLEGLLLDMLAKAPADRPTMTEVVDRLVIVRAELARRRHVIEDAVRHPSAPHRLASPTADEPASRTRRGRRGRRRDARFAVGVLALAAAVMMFVLAQATDRPAYSHTTQPAPVEVAATPSTVPTRTEPPASPPPLTNPVLEDCADPSVLRDGARWYMTCTGGSGGNVFPIYASADLEQWQRVSWIFPAERGRPAWATGNHWAPELRRVGDRYVAYFSMRGRRANAIGVATATTVLGPYTDRGTPLVTHATGASDAHVVDAAGTAYLYYKVESEPAEIWAQPLAADGLELAGPATKVLAASEPWEHAVVEAPVVVREGPTYFLIYSGARYCGTEYALGVARAPSPLGPFEKRAAPILRGGTAWAGPGHASLVDDARGALRIAYHAYRSSAGTPTCEPDQPDDNNRRDVRIDRLVFEHGWPRVVL